MRTGAPSETKKCAHSEDFGQKTFDLPQFRHFSGKPEPLRPSPSEFNAENIISDSAPGSSSNANAKLQMVHGRLLDGTTDDAPQKIQTEVDEMELRMKGDVHHEHDHPTVA